MNNIIIRCNKQVSELCFFLPSKLLVRRYINFLAKFYTVDNIRVCRLINRLSAINDSNCVV